MPEHEHEYPPRTGPETAPMIPEPPGQKQDVEVPAPPTIKYHLQQPDGQ